MYCSKRRDIYECRTLRHRMKHLAFKGFLQTLNFPSFSRCFCSSSFALKNVTKSNFESSLNDLRRHVKDADFVAIDLEMTGITSAPWRESFEFDRFDIRYLKVKDSAEKFAVVQFGVCPFRWDTQKQSFIAHPHNFYIFPRQEITGDNASYEFLCQTTSIDFLAKYQFDFNMCIREGVSYLSRSQEEYALKRLHSRYKDELFDSSTSWSEAADMQLTRMSDVLFAERLKKNISEWRDELLFGRSGGSDPSLNDSNKKFQTLFFKLRPAISLTGFTSRQLRLIQWVIKNHFKDLAYVCANDDNSSPQHLIVYIDSRNDRDLLMKEVTGCTKKDEEAKIRAAIGFRHVIDLLSSEQKLIIGHNCFLDIAHVYQKFIGPLPITSQEYASSIQEYFPYIIDTKVLLNANNVFQLILKRSRTSLSKAFALLCPQIASGVRNFGSADKGNFKVEVQVDDKRSLNWNSGAKHEAGYDAFMTGCVFAQACNLLDIDFNNNPPSVHLACHDKLLKYMNLLYLSWTCGDVIDLRTGESESSRVSVAFNILKSRYPKILFPNIVVLWGFPSKLKASEIKECFSKAFGPDSVTTVFVVDQTAVFIQLHKAELVSRFLELKGALEGSNDPISILHPLAKILEGGRTCAANYEVYREICSSSIARVLFADQVEAVGIKGKTKNSVLDVKKQEDAMGIIHNQVLPDFPVETEIDKLNTDELDSFSPLEAQLSK